MPQIRDGKGRAATASQSSTVEQCPWIVGSLKRRGKAAAFASLHDFAAWTFLHSQAQPARDVPKGAAAFVARAKASPTLARMVSSGAPLDSIAWMLQELTFAEAMRLRAARLAIPVEQEVPALRGVSDRELREARDALETAARLVPTVRGGLDKPQRKLRDVATWRQLAAAARTRPARKPRSPESRVASAVDATWGAPRKDRDEVISQLCREVLGIETTPTRVRAMMKPHRRGRDPGI
jgi:hypothetical protein